MEFGYKRTVAKNVRGLTNLRQCILSNLRLRQAVILLGLVLCRGDILKIHALKRNLNESAACLLLFDTLTLSQKILIIHPYVMRGKFNISRPVEELNPTVHSPSDAATALSGAIEVRWRNDGPTSFIHCISKACWAQLSSCEGVFRSNPACFASLMRKFRLPMFVRSPLTTRQKFGMLPLLRTSITVGHQSSRIIVKIKSIKRSMVRRQDYPHG